MGDKQFRGPGYGATMIVMIELINSDNETVNTIYSSKQPLKTPELMRCLTINLMLI